MRVLLAKVSSWRFLARPTARPARPLPHDLCIPLPFAGLRLPTHLPTYLPTYRPAHNVAITVVAASPTASLPCPSPTAPQQRHVAS